MSEVEHTKKILRLAALLLVAVISAASLFQLCYRFDNKYTAKGPQPMSGVLMLDKQDLEQYPVIYLVRDWEIYRGKLLTPEDFRQNAPLPDETLFIGQYGGFEGHVDGANPARSPHGSATYRLNISLPPETRGYTLELPEIYSAYRLYINGALMAQMGDPALQSYRPETGNSFVTVQAAERMEILIAVSDYSHFYSGMVYPPAFGEPGSVARLLNIRYGLRVAAFAIAVCIGLLYFCVWFLTKKDRTKTDQNILPLLYAALCASFAFYTCYPVSKTLLNGGIGFYAVENFSYCAMILLVLLMQNHISDIVGNWSKAFTVFGAFTCCWALLVPCFMGDSLNLMMAYSGLIGLYAWTSALCLTVCAAYGVWRGIVYNKALLTGVIVFDCALVMDRLLPMFEPIRFGWFTELAGGLFILLIGLVMAMEVARQFRLRQAMEIRVESVSRMMEVQRAYYPVILEKEEETRAARHDLRHHMAVLRELAAEVDSQKLIRYLDAYDDKHIPGVPASYCKHYVTNMLLRMYAALAERQNTAFHVKAAIPEAVAVNDVDLCVILGNLLENALEASQRIPQEKRLISVRIGCELNRLAIFVENNFDGSLRIGSGRFYSVKQKDREGVGLASVQASAACYGGRADFYKDDSNRFHSEVLLPIRNEECEAGQNREVDE